MTKRRQKSTEGGGGGGENSEEEETTGSRNQVRSVSVFVLGGFGGEFPGGSRLLRGCSAGSEYCTQQGPCWLFYLFIYLFHFFT